MTAACSEYFFYIHFKAFEYIKRHECLYSTGESAAVNSACALSRKSVFGKVQRNCYSLMSIVGYGEYVLKVLEA